ncbi:MAG: sterol desaturase family protein [Myxococcota bacterium]
MSIVWAVIAGAFAWTFTEYGMHHWNGHLSKGKLTFSKEHLAHHKKFDYESPWTTQVKMAIPILGAAFGGAWLVGGLTVAIAFTLSLGGSYLAYGWLHDACHVSAPKTAFGRWARRHHFYHHFTSAKYNHGVTSPLWDIVFRTYRAPGLIRVPPRQVMPWLVDEDGKVKPEFADHYELIVKRAPKHAAAA